MAEAFFDIDQIPFSMRGSWLSFSRVLGLHRRGEAVHLVSHVTGMHPILAFQPIGVDAATAVTARVAASSSRLRWVSAAGDVTAAFVAPDVVRLRGRGLGMRISDASGGLTPFTGSYLYTAPADGAAVFTSYETGRRYRITPIDGALTVLGSESLGTAERGVVIGGDAWELAIEQLESVGAAFTPGEPFDGVVAARDREFDEYARAVVPEVAAPGHAGVLAAYVLWSATVAPAGFMTREGVLMSKHWMDKVWSWDHCFNALALASGLPGEALDQFLLPFDHQSDAGAPPDSITHSEVLYNFVKPPIHGWAFAQLRERLPEPLPESVLREVYERLSAWTWFWLNARRAPDATLPFYEHGNDSGWDNSTVFDLDRVIESPDLAAFLVVQLGVLADLADELGMDAASWRCAEASVRDALVGLWDGRRLVARSVSGRVAGETSLLTALPVLAARSLPEEIVDALAAKIRAHLTEYGPATELPDSPRYEADGYWRGPIWAPSTYLLVSGLHAAGRHALADDISARFLRLCEEHGFAENFDALTGEGLRDRAYTWTASVYLLLLREAIE